MPFITQGKANLKYILIIVVLVAIIGEVILYCAVKKEDILVSIGLGYKTPDWVIQAVNKYIIDEIGQEEFQKNYKLNYKKTNKDNLDKNIYENYYFVYYDFLPAIKYGTKPVRFRVYENNKEIEYVNYAGCIKLSSPLPNCQKDNNHCNFLISKDRLDEIVKEKNLFFEGYSPTILMKKDIIVLEIDNCSSGTNISILINPGSGDVVSSSTSACPII